MIKGRRGGSGFKTEANTLDMALHLIQMRKSERLVEKVQKRKSRYYDARQGRSNKPVTLPTYSWDKADD